MFFFFNCGDFLVCLLVTILRSGFVIFQTFSAWVMNLMNRTSLAAMAQNVEDIQADLNHSTKITLLT